LVSKGAKLDFKDNNNKTAKDYWHWTDVSFDEAVAQVFWRKIFFHEMAVQHKLFTTEIIELICQYI
jgi:hypothetical protein